MKKIVVTFLKHVVGSDGHEVMAPQEAVEVSSPTVGEALEDATRRFAEKRHIPDWSLHADGIAIELKS
ncbi:MAG TPA: hypothetical protein VE999_13740 [Gemmataceae bacterium]|nr:hypothetical protein [Gemmataceae bacterium]